MGYKFLGFVVWRGGKWYVKRRARGSHGKLAAAGLTAAVGVGAIVAQRQLRNN